MLIILRGAILVAELVVWLEQIWVLAITTNIVWASFANIQSNIRRAIPACVILHCFNLIGSFKAFIIASLIVCIEID